MSTLSYRGIGNRDRPAELDKAQPAGLAASSRARSPPGRRGSPGWNTCTTTATHPTLSPSATPTIRTAHRSAPVVRRVGVEPLGEQVESLRGRLLHPPAERGRGLTSGQSGAVAGEDGLMHRDDGVGDDRRPQISRPGPGLGEELITDLCGVAGQDLALPSAQGRAAGDQFGDLGRPSPGRALAREPTGVAVQEKRAQGAQRGGVGGSGGAGRRARRSRCPDLVGRPTPPSWRSG